MGLSRRKGRSDLVLTQFPLAFPLLLSFVSVLFSDLDVRVTPTNQTDLVEDPVRVVETSV